MDGLRWLLLLFGLLVVAGVYLFSRHQRDRTEKALPKIISEGRVEPSLDGVGEQDDGSSTTEIDEDSVSDVAEGETPDVATTQKIVTLRIVAGSNSSFAGDELALSLRGIGMRHGKFGIFHRYEGSDEDKVIFSAASLIEPGSFDLTNIKDQEIPGISLFMVLPGPIEGAQAFDLLMVAARALAQSLRAELLDESGSTLSIQRERYMREEIIQFEHSILVA
jgi:cell division protein ZipA